MEPLLLGLDARKRMSLRSINPTSSRYFVEMDEAGVITMTPAVVMTEMEAVYGQDHLLSKLSRKAESKELTDEKPMRKTG